jgi:hypothetical protein
MDQAGSDDRVAAVVTEQQARGLDTLLRKASGVSILVVNAPIELTRVHPNIRGVISLKSLSAQVVSKLPSLRFLKLLGVPLADGVQKELPRGVERLSGEPLDFEALVALPGLTVLETFIRSQKLDALAKLEQLRALRLESLQPMRGGKVFGKLVNLEELKLDRSALPNLDALSKCGRLERLTLATAGSLEGIEALTSLSRLFLMGRACPPLDPLKQAKRLDELVIKTVATPPDLEVLPGLRQLKKLRLWCGTTDSVMEIGNASFFSALTELEVLDGRGGFTIVDQDLSPLGRLKKLKYLSFQGTYPRAVVASLRKQLPDCEFDISVGTPEAAPKFEKVGPLKITESEDGWSIFQDLSATLGYQSNHEVEDAVRAALRKSAANVEKRLEFDSEAGAFAAYAGSREDIEALASIVEGLRRRREKR